MRFIQSIITRRRRRGRRPLPRDILLCLLLALLFGTAPAAKATNVPSTMRVAMLVSENMELYPLTLMDRDALSILNLVYESVMILDDNRDPVPLLAESVDVVGGGTSYVFHLRDNVFFHDGTQLTAYDVYATMNAIRDLARNESLAPNEKGNYCTLIDYISDWSVDDPLTLRVQARIPSYAALYAMTFPVLQAQSLYLPNPPGTGPYRVDYYAQGQEMWLSGNEGWWKQPPHITEIIAVWFENVEDALAAFEAERVDIVMTRQPSAARYRGTLSSRVNSYSYSTRNLETLFMMNAYNLADPEMRKAVAYGINEERLMINVYQNVVSDTDTIQSRRSFLYSPPPQSQTYPYSPEKACEILDRLGWTEYNDKGYRIKRNAEGETRELMFRLFYYDEAGNALRKDAANEIAVMLRSIGIRIRISALSLADAQKNLNSRNFDLLLGSIFFDVAPNPEFLLIDRTKCNYVNYKSNEMTELCKLLNRAGGKEEFALLWAQIQDQFSVDLPFLPLYYRDGVVLTRYPYSNVRDIREFELLRGIESYR